MRYKMRQKIFSFGQDFTIEDEHGNPALFADGHAISLRGRMDIKDMDGNILMTLHRKLLSFGPTYEITAPDGSLIAEVKKHLFTFFKTKFTVDVPGPDDLEAEGNFLEYEYTFRRGSEEVARVTKQWFSFSDCYGIEVAPGENDALIIASATVIDQLCHEGD